MELRSRQKSQLSGFTKAQVEIMEQSLIKSGDECLREDYCKKLSRQFNRSSRLTGKPTMKWAEIQSWFQRNQENCSKKTSSDATNTDVQEAQLENILRTIIRKQRAIGDNPSKVELEAKSSTDGAWYDVDEVLKRRVLRSGEIEFHVRFKGFEPMFNEWVNVKNAIRQRSIPLEDSEDHSDCKKLMAGDPVLCFQETQEEAKYYDAHVEKVQRRVHDARGCRCIFVIRYDHRHNEEEEMPLTRICCQPSMLAQLRDRKDCF